MTLQRREHVDVVAAYRTVSGEVARYATISKDGVDLVTFTAASTVKNFCSLLKERGQKVHCSAACIGPVTAEALTQLDFMMTWSLMNIRFVGWCMPSMNGAVQFWKRVTCGEVVRLVW